MKAKNPPDEFRQKTGPVQGDEEKIIQDIFLYEELPSPIPGLSISLNKVRGRAEDTHFIKFLRPCSRYLDIIMGTVIDKGSLGPLVALSLKLTLMNRAIPFEPVMKIYDQSRFWHRPIHSISQILNRVKGDLIDQLSLLESQIKLLYVRIDLLHWEYSFVDCGYGAPIHLSRQRQNTEERKGRKNFLEERIFKSIHYPLSQMDYILLCPGDLKEIDALFEKNGSLSAEEAEQQINKALLENKLDVPYISIKVTENLRNISIKSASAHFLADFSQLHAVREFVNRICENSPGNVEVLTFELQLAINEIFCNIVEHSYSEEKAGDVMIQGEAGPEGIYFTILDRGKLFDPSQIEHPNLRAGDREGGFGWYIVRNLVDQITYISKNSESGWNSLTIFKNYILGEEQMDIGHTVKDNVLILTPKGDSLDAKEAPSFKEKVVGLIQNYDISNVIFDLHEMNFIDSSGLGCLLSALRLMTTRGGKLKLACITKPVRNMFELVSMQRIFEIYDSLDEAVHSFTVMK